MNQTSDSKKTQVSIDIRLKSAGDFFSSLDPSPLVERDIDNRVEEFIVETAIDSTHEGPITLVVHLAERPSAAEVTALEQSACNYFVFMAEREDQRLKRLWRNGRHALLAGFIFLIVCMALGEALARVIDRPFGDFLREGLLIMGWVANWKPAEIFLYDWRPLLQRKRVYQRLSELTVEIRGGRENG